MCKVTRMYNQIMPGINNLIRSYRPYLDGYVGEDDLRSHARIAIWEVQEANKGEIDPESDSMKYLCVRATRNAIHDVMRTVAAGRQKEHTAVNSDPDFLAVASLDDSQGEIEAREVTSLIKGNLASRPPIYGHVLDQILNPSTELADLIHKRCRADNRKEKMPATPTIRALAELFNINYVKIFRIVAAIRKEFVGISSRRYV